MNTPKFIIGDYVVFNNGRRDVVGLVDDVETHWNMFREPKSFSYYLKIHGQLKPRRTVVKGSEVKLFDEKPKFEVGEPIFYTFNKEKGKIVGREIRDTGWWYQVHYESGSVGWCNGEHIVAEDNAYLSTLVEKVNQGMQALRTLQEPRFRNRVTTRPDGWDYDRCVEAAQAVTVSIQDPRFKAYDCADGWSISMDEGKCMLYIGCTAFRTVDVKEALQALLRNQSCGYDPKGDHINPLFRATRHGIMTRDRQEVMSWESAEELYKKLKKYYRPKSVMETR